MNTRAPAGTTRWTAAIARGGTLGVSETSEAPLITANTATAKEAAITAAGRTRRPALGRPASRIAASALDAGRAIARARNGARNAGKWKKKPGGHMNAAATRAAVATPNHSSGGGRRPLLRGVASDAPANVAATKQTRASVASARTRCPGFTRYSRPIMSCNRVQTGTRAWWYLTNSEMNTLWQNRTGASRANGSTGTPKPAATPNRKVAVFRGAGGHSSAVTATGMIAHDSIAPPKPKITPPHSSRRPPASSSRSPTARAPARQNSATHGSMKIVWLVVTLAG